MAVVGTPEHSKPFPCFVLWQVQCRPGRPALCSSLCPAPCLQPLPYSLSTVSALLCVYRLQQRHQVASLFLTPCFLLAPCTRSPRAPLHLLFPRLSPFLSHSYISVGASCSSVLTFPAFFLGILVAGTIRVGALSS